LRDLKSTPFSICDFDIKIIESIDS
jgi:hypothetical protein